MASDSSSELSTFHKAIEFSLKKLGKPKLELKRQQYDAIRVLKERTREQYCQRDLVNR